MGIDAIVFGALEFRPLNAEIDVRGGDGLRAAHPTHRQYYSLDPTCDSAACLDCLIGPADD